jgi:hypothetical protein
MITKNNYFWKPVIIFIHNSLQGFMVSALRGTNNHNILSEKYFKELEKVSTDTSKDKPKEELLNFLSLYSRVKSPKYSECYFKATNEVDFSVKELNKWRNDFIHFMPKGLSLEVSGFTLIVRDVIGIIEFLVYESNRLYQLDEKQKQEIRSLIDMIIEKNGEIARKYVD